jgi:hypothetical protein
MNLTKIIIEHWKIWMSVPVATNIFGSHNEGLSYYDGEWMTFFYALNHEWYKMNNKKFAFTGCKEEFVEPRDFEEYDEWYK